MLAEVQQLSGRVQLTSPTPIVANSACHILHIPFATLFRLTYRRNTETLMLRLKMKKSGKDRKGRKQSLSFQEAMFSMDIHAKVFVKIRTN